MTTSRGLAPDLLERDVHEIVYRTYDELEPMYSQLANTESVDGAFVDDFSFADFTAFRLKPEGVAVHFDDPVQGDRRRTIMLTFGLGYRVTMEMREDDRHGMIERLSEGLGSAGRHSEELLFWGMYDDFWAGATYTGIPEGDGTRRSLFNTAHVRLKDRVTYSNRVNPGVALSHSGLESAITLMRRQTSDEGHQLRIRPSKLVITTDDEFEAERILESVQQSGTADNDTNTLRRMGLKVLAQPYTTDLDAWSLWPEKHSAKFYRRKAFTMKTAADPQTGDDMHMAHARYNVAFGEPRGPIGSAP